MTIIYNDNNSYGQFARVNSVVTMVLGGAGICGNLLSVIVLSRPVMYYRILDLCSIVWIFVSFLVLVAYFIDLLSAIILSRPVMYFHLFFLLLIFVAFFVLLVSFFVFICSPWLFFRNQSHFPLNFDVDCSVEQLPPAFQDDCHLFPWITQNQLQLDSFFYIVLLFFC